MFRSKFLALGVLLPLYFSAVAQQDPQHSYYFINQFAFNPAYAGSSDMICATYYLKPQFTGFGEGSPTTTGVNIHSPIKPFGLASGIGLGVVSDSYGFNQDVGLSASYAFKIPIRNTGTLSIGLSGGFINNSLSNVSWSRSNDGDPKIPATDEASFNFDLGFGLFFRSQEMFFGVSSTHLNETRNTRELDSHYRRHFYLTGGYTLPIASTPWEFQPSVLVATNLANNQFAITANMLYNKKVWGGLQYRVGDAVVAMFGFELFNGLRIGYAYDFPVTALSRYTYGSHELMIGYCFSLKRETPPQQYRSIRFL